MPAWTCSTTGGRSSGPRRSTGARPTSGRSAFRCDSRTHRAAVCVVRGDWQRGAEEAAAAATESRAYDLGHTAQALTALGEIRLRQGDLVAAREAFAGPANSACRRGPGPALLLLAGGDVAAARVAIAGSLGPASGDPLIRARYLPAAIEIGVAAGDFAEADTLRDELAPIAAAFAGPALAAAALDAAGSSPWPAATPRRLSPASEMPYSSGGPPAPHTRRPGVSGREGGRRPRRFCGAAREAQAALAAFDRLGARLEVEAATQLLVEMATAS